jgi:Predicted membrane protein (DUF2306)
MSTAVLTNRIEISFSADTVLNAATRFWFGVTIVGQLAFGFAVASFYGLTALRGDFHAWSKFITHGWVAGDRMGNLAIAMHVASAALIMLSGAAQLAPSVRDRFPVFHHWNGRVYMLTAVAASVAGVYMTWFRGSVGDLTQHLGGSLNAAVIWLCAGMALHYAMARNFRTHRRWALRLFMATSASWFYRIVFFLMFLIFQRPVGFDPATFTGPFPSFMAFGSYLLPLAILEIYFRTQDRPGAVRRMAMATGLFVVSLAMVAGLFAVTMAVWVPDVKAGFDARKSIAETMAATIATSGIDRASEQYRELKTTQPTLYNFDEDELNSLGYQLIHAKKFSDAVRVLQLNADAYPNSSNAYDSLGEAYMEYGIKPLAIANYERSLQLNPKNLNAARMLQKLKAP